MPSAKAAEAIAASVERMFGAEIEVRYHDAGDPDVIDAHGSLLEELAGEGIPLPATFLDGELIYAGAINPLRVVVEGASARQRRAGGVTGA